MAAPKKEYFNLYVESIPSQSGDFKPISLIACEKEDIYKYLLYLKENQLGFRPFGNQQIEIVIPKTLVIYDFSKTKLNPSDENRDNFENEVRINYKRNLDYSKTFSILGKNVTDTLGIKLEDYLPKGNKSSTTSTTTATTTQSPPISTTNTKTTTVDESKQTEEDQKELKLDTESDDPKRDRWEKVKEVFPIRPKAFSEGIIDNSIEPAFDVKKVAKVFADHIRTLKDENGQMVGVFGQWGRGKTYFIDQVLMRLNLNLKVKKKVKKVPFKENKWNYLKTHYEHFKQKISNSFTKEKKIKEDSPFILVKFQAWKYQNAPSVWAYLFETFIEEYLNVKNRQKYSLLIRLSIARNGHFKSWIWPILLIVIGIFTFSFSSKFIKEVEGQNILKIVSALGTLGISLGSWSSIQKKIQNPATDIFNSISKAPSFKEVLGVQAEVQKELKSLVKAWSKIIEGKRILLFVDDLDRCSQLQMIDIIDSLRIMLDDELITENVLILVALDEKKLGKAIKNKYEKLFEKEELAGVVDEYMDKLFISAIKLHAISIGERSEFVKKLICGINSEVFQEDIIKKNPTSTPTPTPAATPTLETGKETELKSVSTPIPTPSLKSTPEDAKSIKNLEAIEVKILEENIRVANQDLTPRQIRILIYRYLLARNLWIEFFGEERFEAEEAISEIMRFSGYRIEDPNAFPEINYELSKIARLVVAY